jgi:hypothetical protein
MQPSLSRIEQELRRAVESQRYAEVQRLVLEFCRAAEAHARSLPPADPRIGEIATMTQDVLQWTRAMVKSSRASLIFQLQQIPKVKRYVPAPIRVPSTMHLDA